MAIGRPGDVSTASEDLLRYDPAQLAALAERGRPGAFVFPRPMTDRPGLDFSFSGLKTAVRIRATALGLAHGRFEGSDVTSLVRDLVASFQRTGMREKAPFS